MLHPVNGHATILIERELPEGVVLESDEQSGPHFRGDRFVQEHHRGGFPGIEDIVAFLRLL
jgi:hypothetical protein